MEKKVEVITTRGIKIKVAEHMLKDMARFGAMRARPNVKETPRELLKPIVPRQVIKPEDPLPEMITTEVKEDVLEKTPIKRKAPVKSKSTK
jgi:hypothetical protein